MKEDAIHMNICLEYHFLRFGEILTQISTEPMWHCRQKTKVKVWEDGLAYFLDQSLSLVLTHFSRLL